jgi:predicted DNA-binding protein
MATFRLPASKILKLKELSEKRDTTQSELVNYALDKLFNELNN